MATSPLLATVLIATTCVVIATGAPVPADTGLASKYESFNVDSVIGNDRILTNYIKCLMDQGSCTNEGRDLKKTIPDALAGGCSQCSEKQRQTTERVIKHLKDNRKSDWDRLVKKYDPKGIYEKQYLQLLNPQKSGATEQAKDAKATSEKSADTKVSTPAEVQAKEKSKPAVKKQAPTLTAAKI